MIERAKFLLNRLRERLWVRPLVMCLLSVLAVFLAKSADYFAIDDLVPRVWPDTTETLLKILGSSMLVIATFAVGSMVASYASASANATPRSLPIVISDDVSQNALSGFIGAFIFSIVALVALKSGLYGKAGQFVLFCATLTVFAAVILVFLRWVDCIARLGRLGTTIDKVEKVTAESLSQRRRSMTLGGLPISALEGEALELVATQVGYIQRVDLERLQALAEKAELRVELIALPGAFAAPNQPLARLWRAEHAMTELAADEFREAFQIGKHRNFANDPRFGFIVLSEIAGRALSPAVNDPGTAIEIIGSFVRLFDLWAKPLAADQTPSCRFDRVHVPVLDPRDLFDDAFTAMARDGAGSVEVVLRLQKGLRSLAEIGDSQLTHAAVHHARLVLARAEAALTLPEERAAVREATIGGALIPLANTSRPYHYPTSPCEITV